MDLGPLCAAEAALADREGQLADAQALGRPLQASIDTTLGTGEPFALDLREAARTMQIEFRGQSYGGLAFSVGVGVFPDHGADAGTLLQRADEALYPAKAPGRDRVLPASTS